MMTQDQLKVEDPVVFGRPNGKKMKGVVKKLNNKSAKLLGDDNRMWNVAYALIYPDNGSTPSATPAPVRTELVYNQFNPDNKLLDCLLDCYAGLSPENLTCDGEASAAHVRQQAATLNRKIKGITAALGYHVDEGDLYVWDRKRQDAKRKAG